jgi:hypothetical protein
MARVLAAIFGAVLPISIAVADETPIPRYDVKAHCNELANFGGTFSQMVMSSCLGMEQTAYDKIKKDWTNIPNSIRRYCNQIATFGGSGSSYSVFESCIEIETGAARRNAETEFHY